MHMIRGDMSLENIDAQLPTFCADDGADPFCHLATEHLVTILRDPDNV
jgi:hypothetical protein